MSALPLGVYMALGPAPIVLIALLVGPGLATASYLWRADDPDGDHTVMAISGHSSTRMLERYTHPTDSRKLEALETFASIDGPKVGRTENPAA